MGEKSESHLDLERKHGVGRKKGQWAIPIGHFSRIKKGVEC